MADKGIGRRIENPLHSQMEDQGNSNSNGSSTGSEKGSGTRITRSQRGGGSSGGGGGNSSSAEESTTGKDSFMLSVAFLEKHSFSYFSLM